MAYGRAAGCLESFPVKSSPAHFTVRNAATQSNSPSHTAATAETALSSPKSVPGQPLSYRGAGVDIDAGDRLVEAIKPFAKRTLRPEVLAGIGGFGALIELPKRYREPVLVAGTDGVGTKLKLAFAHEQARHHRHRPGGDERQRHSGSGRRAAVLSRLLRLRDARRRDRQRSHHAASREAASRPVARWSAARPPSIRRHSCPANTISPDSPSASSKNRARSTARRIAAGDVLIGLASSGPHSNGFSLIRSILERAQPDLAQKIAGVTGERTLGETLLEPTRIYVKPVLALLADVDVKAMAHITGGGLSENTHRMFPDHLAARIDARSWPRPPIFDWLQRQGNVDAAEMHRVFNCGIGFVLVVAADAAKMAIERLAASGERAYAIGTVVPRAAGAPGTVVA